MTENWVNASEPDFGIAVHLPDDLALKIANDAPEAGPLFLAYIARRVSRMVADGLLANWRGDTK